MNDGHNCNKTVIADHSGFKVIYCETHKIAELIIGGISLRLDVENFNNLNELLNTAYRNLNLITGSQAAYNELLLRLNNKSY